MRAPFYKLLVVILLLNAVGVLLPHAHAHGEGISIGDHQECPTCTLAKISTHGLLSSSPQRMLRIVEICRIAPIAQTAHPLIQVPSARAPPPRPF